MGGECVSEVRKKFQKYSEGIITENMRSFIFLVQMSNTKLVSIRTAHGMRIEHRPYFVSDDVLLI
jgi:hypothetical protein